MLMVFETKKFTFPIKVERNPRDGKFRVTYGASIRSGLDYSEAAHELGECMFHAFERDGKLHDDKETK